MILVINCGSSSAKYEILDIKNGKVLFLAKGLIERIGEKSSRLLHKKGNRSFNKNIDCADHYKAIKILKEVLLDKRFGVLNNISEIKGIGHRVVHGGEDFREATVITKKVIDTLKKYNKLAPLHNPPSLLGIKACLKEFPNCPEVAVFDTAFFHTMPEKAYLYALPYKFYTNYNIRRFGFHGTSHKYVAYEAAKALKKPLNRLKLITCHLGNGCSMAAILHGRAIDTSMGFTPLEGLVMGTRSGDIDPAIIIYLMEKEGLNLKEINNILNKESGLLGLSEISNDMRDLKAAIRKGNRKAGIALEIFIYRIVKYIGAYTASMNGIDAVVFTAGIGQNNPDIINKIKNSISEIIKKFKTKILVIPTNEELMIARDTYEKIRNPKSEFQK